MDGQAAIQQMLREKFGSLKASNPRFSLRAFSRKAGIASGAISQILSGKRRISRKLAEHLCDALLFSPLEKEGVLSGFPKQPVGASQKMSSHALEIEADRFALIADWVPFAILSLLRTDGFRSDVDWIASRLGTPKRNVSQALERLVKLGFVERKKNGSIRRSAQDLRSTDGVPSTAVRSAHFQGLDLAAKALESVPLSHRDFYSLTMPANPKAIEKVRKLTREYMKKASLIMGRTPPRKEVYRLFVQLFPLTVISTEGDHK